MQKRKSDTDAVQHLQTERIFRSDNEWYICTREGIGVGPYETELVARSRADELIKRLGPLKSQDDIMAAIRNFVFETSGLEEERQAS